MQRGRPDGSTELVGAGLLLVDVLVHEVGVVVGELLEQPVAPLARLLAVLAGDLAVLPLLAHALVGPDVSLHLDQVDDPLEVLLDPEGELDDQRVGVEPLGDHPDGAFEVGPGPIHLVDEADPRDAVPVGLAPHSLGLRFDPRHRVEHGHRAI